MMRHSLLGLVMLASLSAAAEPAQAPAHAVAIARLRFDPPKLAIHAGETVVWTDKDDRDYTIVAADGSFKSDVLHRGESYSHTFEKPGKYAYGCKLHPRMKGLIVVEPPKTAAGGD